MPPKVGGVYALSQRGKTVVDKYGYGTVTDTLIGLDRDVELLKSMLVPASNYVVRKDDSCLVG
jgi:hypothetical protein